MRAILNDDWNWIVGGSVSAAAIVIATFGVKAPPFETAVIAAVAFVLVTTLLGPIWPGPTTTAVAQSVRPALPQVSGDAAKELLSKAEPQARQFRKSVEGMDDVTGQTLRRMSQLLDDVLARLYEDPSKVVQVRRLLTFYLPKAVTMANAYATLIEKGQDTPRLIEVRDGIASVDKAFKHYAELLSVSGLDTLDIDLRLLKASVKEDVREF